MISTSKVLVVEDDFLIAMQSEAALADAGFVVIGTAATAEEAVSLATGERPSLAIMDIRLAGKRDGIDAARELFQKFGIRAFSRQRMTIFKPDNSQSLMRHLAGSLSHTRWRP